MQETFLSALAAYPRLRNDDNLKAWILTIAHRKAMDMHRVRSRQAIVVADVPDRAGPEAPEGNAALWQAVSGLPAKQRAAITLRYVVDLPHREVACIMGTSEDAARRNVHEGVKALRSKEGLR